jgi:glycosyltransferase involved in cell wall biosynthesis
MNIVLATGIYPPDIGGVATYVRSLAEGLSRLGNCVSVLTYGRMDNEQWTMNNGWKVFPVKKNGGPFVRWFRYARALRAISKDADAIVAFSSVSVGIPLLLSGVRKPKKILRLGGDFFWERYTAMGGMLGLEEWYKASPFRLTRILNSALMDAILSSFDHIVYSTTAQRQLHAYTYRSLPVTSVIENAVPSGTPMEHAFHRPMRLLSFGRFVGFKNLFALLSAVAMIPDVRLTMVGKGPLHMSLMACSRKLGLQNRVQFQSPVSGAGKRRVFDEHDLLVIPSVTEISPNAALEARSAGLPVLLTEKTGLSRALTSGMTLAPLRTPECIAEEIRRIRNDYPRKAHEAAAPSEPRDWAAVTRDWDTLIKNLS